MVASDTTKVSKPRLPGIRAVALTEAVNVDNQKSENGRFNVRSVAAASCSHRQFYGRWGESHYASCSIFTGMRRGEMFKLKWFDADFQRDFIRIRHMKGGVSQKIALNDQVRQVLENYPKTADNVFVRGDGKSMKSCIPRQRQPVSHSFPKS